MAVQVKRAWLFNVVLIGLVMVAHPIKAQEEELTDPAAIAEDCGGTAAVGELIYAAQCAACHALTADAPPMRGPHLQDLRRRPAAALSDFPYSQAMRAAGQDGLIWERESLHAFVADPAGFMPGTLMDHDGIKDDQTIRDLLTYIRTASLSPPPAPGELVVSEEVWALEGDPEYGEYLAGECAGCHQADQSAPGIPNINGLRSEAFIYAMHEYRARARSNEAMQLIAGRLSDDEIASLAAWFETLK